MANNPKGAWKTHRVCEHCKVIRTKNKYCSKCEPIVRSESKVDKDGLTKKQREDYIRRAREKYQSEGSVEIDDGAKISVSGDKGVYVEAWVWVYDDE